jgi:ribosomal-protein-alanine N-acetyltransferase
MELCSDRLLMRPWIVEDAGALAELANNRNVWLNLRSRFPKPYTKAAAEAWIRRRDREAARSIQFAIVVEDSVAGGIGIERDLNPRAKAGELGYWLGEAFWNRGLAGEAVERVAAWAFSDLGLARLSATVREANPASSRLLEKAGFRLASKVRRGGRRPSAHVVEYVYVREA